MKMKRKKKIICLIKKRRAKLPCRSCVLLYIDVSSVLKSSKVGQLCEGDMKTKKHGNCELIEAYNERQR